MTEITENAAAASETSPPLRPTAVLDEAHMGDITGAFGTIGHGDHGPRIGWRARASTLLAILGPGLIVMVGDNDAGAFSTYAQAGQNYGTTLLWTLMLLIPVLYVNQEMVLRLGAVSGVGHARLILERFGKFWGAFSVVDLFLLNALTIVTEFIGISLAFSYLGLPTSVGVLGAAALVMLAVSTGNFRRFERFAVFLVFGSLLLVPLILLVHPPIGQLAHDFFVPQMPQAGQLGEVMVVVIAIVGTTVAPWQLFFQQSYVVDKRITPRFIKYERLDLLVGIAFMMIGAVAILGSAAAAFSGQPEAGNFTDTAAIAAGLEKYAGHLPAILFTLALIDACIIGASAVSLSTAYAIGDILSLRHSLHRKVDDARGFYGVYFGLVLLSAVLVLTPGTPLGLLTNAVQALAGVLLPSATAFLLLLCNDKDVLGPWVNSRGLNLFTGAIIAVLVMLSLILTLSVLFSDIGETQIVGILIGGTILAVVVAIGVRLVEPVRAPTQAIQDSVPPTEQIESQRATWRMPPLAELPAAKLTTLSRVWLIVLRSYLLVAAGLVLIRIVQLTTTGAEIAFATFYVGVILLAARFWQRSGVILVAAGCVALTILGYFLAPRGGDELGGAVNTLISIGAIALTTGLTLKDITNRKLAEQRLVTQHSVVRILALATTVEDAMPKILQAVCESLRWDVGTWWRVDQAAGVLRCAETWRVETVDVAQFEAVTRESTFQPGQGLLGQVWASRAPACIPDVMRDEAFFRAVGGAQDGLHAALAFPILFKGEVVGVIDLLSREVRQPDQDSLDVMALVGSQIGQFIERSRAENALQLAQAELAHMSRVLTMGELTASIAHEINQPLTGLVTNGNACLRYLAGGRDFEGARRAVERMMRDALRANEIITRIRALSRKAPPKNDRLSVNAIVLEVASLLRTELRRNDVKLETQLASDLPPILGDHIQLQQVVLNLILNGKEAMTGVVDGRRDLVISSQRMGHDEVLVRVSDTGQGIDEGKVNEIFEAFYTTKAGGMGMGLTITRSIVEAHGGRLWAMPNQPRGAIFQFTIPIAQSNRR